MILKCAYVYAVLNIATRQVEKTLIINDENPTVSDHLKAWLLVFKAHGRTVQDANKAARHQLETSIHYRWAHDLLAN